MLYAHIIRASNIKGIEELPGSGRWKVELKVGRDTHQESAMVGTVRANNLAFKRMLYDFKSVERHKAELDRNRHEHSSKGTIMAEHAKLQDEKMELAQKYSESYSISPNSFGMLFAVPVRLATIGGLLYVGGMLSYGMAAPEIVVKSIEYFSLSAIAAAAAYAFYQGISMGRLSNAARRIGFTPSNPSERQPALEAGKN